MSFYTLVIQKHQLFHTDKRVDDPTLLEPTMRAKIEAVLAQLGPGWKLHETYRSRQRQRYMFDAGTSKRLVGTHEFGLAADIVRLDAHGNPTWQADYAPVGKAAASAGLVWGGDWDSEPATVNKFNDLVHVQWCKVTDQPALFAGKFYPDSQYLAR